MYSRYRNSKCKDPEKGTFLECLRNSQENSRTKGKSGGKSSQFLFSLLFLMPYLVPYLRILMGRKTALSLRFNFLCTEGLHSHSFEIMTYYDVPGPAPSTGEIYLFWFTRSLKMAAYSTCIYRGLRTSRHSSEVGVGNQAACRSETCSVIRRLFFPCGT